MLLIGTGTIASEYVKVLNAFDIKPLVVGNTDKSCNYFAEKNAEKVLGILPGTIKNNRVFDTHAIVAVPILETYKIAIQLIERGIKNILLEKPGCLSIKQLKHISSLEQKYNADVRIAYNRRFFNSILTARSIIQIQGLKKLFFSFGDDWDIIADLPHARQIKEKWIIANSSHLIDSVFFISGSTLKDIDFFREMRADKMWHTMMRNLHKFSFFKGNGFFKNGGFWEYETDWTKDKKWKICFETNTGEQYILSPIEILSKRLDDNALQLIASTVDGKYKLGFLEMVMSFCGNKRDLPTTKEQIELLQICNKIGGYR